MFLVLAAFGIIALVWYWKRGKAGSVECFQCEESEKERCWERIRGMEGVGYEKVLLGAVCVERMDFEMVNSESRFMLCLESLSNEKCIGVDVEEYRGNSYLGFVCLIQLASEKKVFVIDALKVRKMIPRLGKVFSDEKIVKVFHGGFNDTQWLQRDFGIVTVNVFDTHIAAKMLGLKRLGLNYLWKKFCGYVMTSEYKKKMQTSRWDLRPLTQEQIVYAATDAFYLPFLMSQLLERLSEEHVVNMRKETNGYCLKGFCNEISVEKCLKVMKKNAIQAIDSRSLFWFVEMFKMRDEYAKECNLHVRSVIETEVLVRIAMEKPANLNELRSFDGKNRFLNKFGERILRLSEGCKQINHEILVEHTEKINTRKQKKQERYQKFVEKYTINKRVYENCQIQAPDGEILCFADSKKANWYVERDLAQVIQQSPLIIRLNFEPNGRGFSDVEADQLYYSKEKKNECVSCGSTKSYLKYHVVPLLYRQYFPENYKSHRSHDVVLLCVKCHEVANKHSDVLKKRIAAEYGVPLNAFSQIHKNKAELNGIRKLAKSILKNGKAMPEERKEALMNQVDSFIIKNQQYAEFFEKMSLEESISLLAKEEFCNKLLSVFGELNWKKELGNSHGKMVVEQLTDLKAFIRRWRVFFIETLSPQFLPDSWNVDHLLNSPKFK